MAIKKKYSILILLVALFMVFCAFSSTCYATISRDYLDYTLDTLSQSSFEYTNKSMTSNYQSLLADLKNNYASGIYQKILEFQTNNGYDNLTDVNMITFIYANTTNNLIDIFFTFSNASVPNGVSNLGYLKLNTSSRNNKLGYIFSNDTSEPVKLLNLQFNKIYSTPTLTYNSRSMSDFVDGSREVYLNNFTFNSDYTVLSSDSIAGFGLPSLFVNDPNTSHSGYMILLDMNGNYNPVSPEPEPDSPSGDSGLGNITTASGDNGGNINLQPIQQGLTDIQNQISGDSQRIINNQNQNTQTIVNSISGEVSKIVNSLTNEPNISDTEISSSDITDSLGFEFMEDPYANFWLSLTTGLSGALTNNVRQIPVDWLGYNGVFDLDSLGFNYPTSLRLILTSVSTVSMVWILVKWWKIIIDKLTSGNMDEVLAMNEEERNN